MLLLLSSSWSSFFSLQFGICFQFRLLIVNFQDRNFFNYFFERLPSFNNMEVSKQFTNRLNPWPPYFYCFFPCYLIPPLFSLTLTLCLCLCVCVRVRARASAGVYVCDPSLCFSLMIIIILSLSCILQFSLTLIRLTINSSYFHIFFNFAVKSVAKSVYLLHWDNRPSPTPRVPFSLISVSLSFPLHNL